MGISRKRSTAITMWRTRLSGALIGFVLPLAAAVEHSVNPYDLAIWATIALAVQLLVYAATRLVLPDVGRDIPAGKVASGVFLAAMSVGAGILSAASMSYWPRKPTIRVWAILWPVPSGTVAPPSRSTSNWPSLISSTKNARKNSPRRRSRRKSA